MECRVVVLSFLMKYKLLPLETASHGHTGLCLVCFPDGVPESVHRLAALDEHTPLPADRLELFVCSRETYQANR